MGERSYLSIGDVLALLREEFPDITISKIRFLESRGLLVPERTPSGYRKFYDHDVERLRWILRQQREHFLPLKVIKGRLEGADAAGEPTSLFDSAEAAPEGAGESRARVSPLRATNGSLHPSVSDGAEEEAVHSRVATMTRHGERDAVGGGRDGDSSPGPGRAEATPGSEGRAGPGASKPEDAHGSSRGRKAGEDADTPGASTTAPAASSPRPEAPVGAGAAEPSPGSKAPGDTAREAAPLGGTAPLDGTAMTVGELAEASGLSDAEVEQLESFGLIEGRTVAGVHCFDETALAVAGLASGFSDFGVEARHLRIFKHAAERQAGLYSQVVMPFLRQRNPEARARALEILAKLSDLGASLQACFAKEASQDLTGR